MEDLGEAAGPRVKGLGPLQTVSPNRPCIMWYIIYLYGSNLQL